MIRFSDINKQTKLKTNKTVKAVAIYEKPLARYTIENISHKEQRDIELDNNKHNNKFNGATHL